MWFIYEHGKCRISLHPHRVLQHSLYFWLYFLGDKGRAYEMWVPCQVLRSSYWVFVGLGPRVSVVGDHDLNHNTAVTSNPCFMDLRYKFWFVPSQTLAYNTSSSLIHEWPWLIDVLFKLSAHSFLFENNTVNITDKNEYSAHTNSLVSVDCCNENATDWRMKQYLFPMVLEARSLRSGVWWGPSSWFAEKSLLFCSHVALRRRKSSCVSACEDTSPVSGAALLPAPSSGALQVPWVLEDSAFVHSIS